ncbi:hypothetical protein M407DRAFT_214104 [Tulasnella calospora MUT 4182]|uniref:F-box domain-containing protein n=1 Tax=Tulasnella calospora MUT 4182 TaxID=1051891 RepID=A0A0C3QDM7_9AGAM|nr:hypothetical protein M407DRAFT_214104 [Tulasnella calospora MUT 4182]
MVVTRGKRISYIASDDLGLDSDGQSDASSTSNRRMKKKRKSAHKDHEEPYGKTSSGRAQKSRRGEKLTPTTWKGFGALPVCRSVEPLDLLNLARLSKRFRSVLMSKNSRQIWEDARASILDLPERPLDLSEPEYASLMFDVGCQWIRPSATVLRDPDAQDDPSIPNAVMPSVSECPGENASTVTYDIIKNGWPSIPQRLLDAMPSYSVLPFWRADQGQTLYIRRLVEDAQHTLEQEELESPSYERLLDETCGSLQKLCDMLFKTGKDMEQWSRSQMRARRDENAAIGHQRFQKLWICIKERIVAAGWKPGDIPRQWRWDATLNRLMCSPQPMTDRKQGREARLDEESGARKILRKKSIAEYLSEFVEGQIAMDARLPKGTFLDPRRVLEIPSVANIVEATDSKFACRLLWTMTLDEVERVNRIHQEQLVADLQRILKHDSDKPLSIPLDELDVPIESYHKISVSDINFQSQLDFGELALATSAFYCPNSTCRNVLWFPTITEHKCCVKKPFLYEREDRSWLGGRFVKTGLKTARDLRPLILRLLEELDLGPTSTYAEAMDLGDSCLCMRCDPLVAPITTFDELVTHYATEHRWWTIARPAAGLAGMLPNLPEDQPLPELVHTHDLSDQSPLVSIVNGEQRATLQQDRAGDEPRRQALINSLDALEPDADAILFGDLIGPSHRRERRRTCLLCPAGWKNFVDPIIMEDHIRTRHSKTPNLVVDSKRRCWDWH